MKKFMIYILAVTALFAQQPDYTEMANQMYQKMQDSVVPKTKEMLINLKKAKNCLEKADSKSEATSCFKEIDKLADVNEKKMMEDYGITQEQMDAQNEQYEEDEDFIWDKKTKRETLKELDDSIEQSSASIKCFETSSNLEAFSICAEKAAIQ